MNKVWQQLGIATNWPILVAVAVLTTMGTLSIWADTRNAVNPEWPKHLVFTLVAIVAMAAFQTFDYRLIGRFSWGFYLFSLVLILYTVLAAKLAPHGIAIPFARPIKGACNWLNFGSISLQPSELTKVAFVMVLARYLRFRSNYRTLLGLLPPFGLALFPLALILQQPDLGTALVFIPALFAMLFVAGAKLWHLLAIVCMGGFLSLVVWLCGPAPDGPDLPVFRHFPAFVKPYQRGRVYAMFSKDANASKKFNYQTDRALTAIGSGGVTGKGIGNIPVGRGVPEGHNDMVFALIGEQFGFVGSAIVLAAYIVLFTAGIEIAGATREPFGRLLALGIVATMAGQTFINLLVVLRLMPVTGITLPFVSYGGSSLLASFMAAGLLLNIGQNRPMVMARDAFEFDA